MTALALATSAIALAATVGILMRPFRWPEAVWAVGGAVALVVVGALPAGAAWSAVGRGLDVYLFLTGMMLLSENARREGLFDWVAVVAVNHARRSPRRLFALVYVVGVVVTTFLSNDATAVVLTPAVYSATKRAGVRALPYLFVCAFVANAASFVLPISNPANLVLYGDHVPPLATWLGRFALPSAAAILVTYLALRWTEGRGLEARCDSDLPHPPLGIGARVALAGLAVTAVGLSVVSALDRPLGLPTAIAGIATSAVSLAAARKPVGPLVRGVSWSVLPLVAGLFVLVEGLARIGLIERLGVASNDLLRLGPRAAAAIGGAAVAVASNVVNNLSAGLVAGSVVRVTHPPQAVVDALLIGVDLGPNLSITGSLATILWLIAIRREGENVGFRRFLALGTIVMTPALIVALAARLAIG